MQWPRYLTVYEVLGTEGRDGAAERCRWERNAEGDGSDEEERAHARTEQRATAAEAREQRAAAAVAVAEAEAAAHLTRLSPHSRPHSPCTHPSRCACPSACAQALSTRQQGPQPAWGEAAARVTSIA